MTAPQPSAPIADARARRLPPAARDALLLVALCALFYAPALDPGRQFLFRDAGRMHLPVKTWIAGELARGHLPEWNPYAGVGVPVVATGVDAALHPFQLLLVLLPVGAGFKGWVILSALAGGLGAAAWARRLGARGQAPLIAGAAFLLSGFLVSSTDNLTYLTALAAAPWLLAAGHAFAVEGGPARLAAVAVASWLCAAAGDPMGWGVAVGLASVQTAWVAADRRSGLARAASLALACAVAAAPVILPVILWIPHSSRGGAVPEAELLAWNLAPARLLELVVPHVSRGPLGDVYDAVYEAIAPSDPKWRPWVISVYVGAPTVALAAAGAWKDRRGRALVGGAALLTWTAMGPHAGFGAIARTLPVLGSLRYWEKLAAWPAMLLAAAAALGAAAVVADARAARRVAIGAVAAAAILLLLAGVALLAPDTVGGILGPGARGAGVRAALGGNVGEGALHAALALFVLAAVAETVARGRLLAAAPLLLVGAVALDLGVANARAWVLSPAQSLTDPPPLAAAARAAAPWPRVVTPFTPPEPRFSGLTLFESKWRVGHLTLDAAWNVPERVGNFDAYTGMIPARLLHARNVLGGEGLIRHAPLWGFSLVVAPARAGLADAGIPAPLDVVGSDGALGAWLLRLPHRSRAYVSRAVPVADANAALAFASTEPTDSDRSAVEGPVPPRQATAGVARLVVDEGERVTVETDVPGEDPALLVLSDQHAPGWSAEIDGTPSEILRANYLVRGVWVPAGRHAVTFRYRTPGLREGWLLAAALAAALAGWARWRRGAARRWAVGEPALRLDGASPSP